MARYVGYRLFKVMQFVTIRNGVYDFLLVFNSNVIIIIIIIM